MVGPEQPHDIKAFYREPIPFPEVDYRWNEAQMKQWTDVKGRLPSGRRDTTQYGFTGYFSCSFEARQAIVTALRKDLEHFLEVVYGDREANITLAAADRDSFARRAPALLHKWQTAFNIPRAPGLQQSPLFADLVYHRLQALKQRQYDQRRRIARKSRMRIQSEESLAEIIEVNPHDPRANEWKEVVPSFPKGQPPSINSIDKDTAQSTDKDPRSLHTRYPETERAMESLFKAMQASNKAALLAKLSREYREITGSSVNFSHPIVNAPIQQGTRDDGTHVTQRSHSPSRAQKNSVPAADFMTPHTVELMQEAAKLMEDAAWIIEKTSKYSTTHIIHAIAKSLRKGSRVTIGNKELDPLATLSGPQLEKWEEAAKAARIEATSLKSEMIRTKIMNHGKDNTSLIKVIGSVISIEGSLKANRDHIWAIHGLSSAVRKSRSF